MFNISQVATETLLRGSRAVVAEARATLEWARRILASLGRAALRLAGPQVSAFRSLLRETARAVSHFVRLARKLGKGELREVATFAEMAERLALLLGRLTHLADRLSAFVETRFLALLAEAQKAISAAAIRISRLARTAMKAARSVFDRLLRTKETDTPKALRPALLEAAETAEPALSAIRFLEGVREGANQVLTQVDPAAVAPTPANFAVRTLDSIFDVARALRELVRLDRFIRALRRLRDAASEVAGTGELPEHLGALLGYLETLYVETMGAAADAMARRVRAAAEARRLEARLARARPEDATQAQILRLLVG